MSNDQAEKSNDQIDREKKRREVAERTIYSTSKNGFLWGFDPVTKRHSMRIGHFWSDLYQISETEFEGRLTNIRIWEKYSDLESAKNQVEMYAIYKIKQAFEVVLQIEGKQNPPAG